MLIHIDSSFAQFNETSGNETIQIPINNLTSHALQDYTTTSPLVMSFQWISNSSNVSIIPIDTNQCIITNVEEPTIIDVYNYFYGLPILFQGKSSTIIQFDNKTNVITCQDNIFSSYYFEHLGTNDSNIDEFIVSCEILNPSFLNNDDNEKQFFLLGTDYKKISTDMIVENQTKRWTSAIRSVNTTYVILEDNNDSLSYDKNDRFIVYRRDLISSTRRMSLLRSLEYTTSQIVSLQEENRTLYGFEVKQVSTVHVSETSHYISLLPPTTNYNGSTSYHFFILKIVSNADDSSIIIYVTEDMNQLIGLNLQKYIPFVTKYESIRCNLDLNLNLLKSSKALRLKLQSLLIPRTVFSKSLINQTTPVFSPYLFLQINHIKNKNFAFNSTSESYSMVAFPCQENDSKQYVTYTSDQVLIIQSSQDLRDKFYVSLYNTNNTSIKISLSLEEHQISGEKLIRFYDPSKP